MIKRPLPYQKAPIRTNTRVLHPASEDTFADAHRRAVGAGTAHVARARAARAPARLVAAVADAQRLAGERAGGAVAGTARGRLAQAGRRRGVGGLPGEEGCRGGGGREGEDEEEEGGWCEEVMHCFSLGVWVLWFGSWIEFRDGAVRGEQGGV